MGKSSYYSIDTMTDGGKQLTSLRQSYQYMRQLDGQRSKQPANGVHVQKVLNVRRSEVNLQPDHLISNGQTRITDITMASNHDTIRVNPTLKTEDNNQDWSLTGALD
ncbi:uncharacterized protein [Ptychodera flava]|uniref:uncharacterized protein n=1 Tax=Ptychodera flava TaxID=63121 RepID=UPI00396AA41A